MSLIRCLGRITLPASYKTFMRREVDYYNMQRLYDPAYGNPWIQEWIANEGHPEAWKAPLKTHTVRGMNFSIEKPRACPALEAKLAKLFKGEQVHVSMTLMSVGEHDDNYDDQLATTLLIPAQVSPCHYLVVDGEERQLKANHIYAFSQLRKHELQYRKKETNTSKPASILAVSFKKK
jgi:hypothetical protein